MKITKMSALFIATVLTIILVVGVNCFGSRHPLIVRQNDSTVTDQEKAQVQQFAKQFVARLLKTRDVAPLIPEFFLNDFTALSKQDFYEKVSPELYAKLSADEKVRLFVAQENLGYIITLDVIMQPDSHAAASLPPFKRILPVAIARKLSRSRLVEGTTRFTDREKLLKELVDSEKSIRRARPFLKARNLEHSATFLRKFGTYERDPHLGYRVRGSIIDDELRRESRFARFAAGQKVFSVDTPILIELVLVNDGGRLKILTLLLADGD